MIGMTRASYRFSGLVLAAALCTPARSADADRGEALAKQWCASCHIVAPDQRHGGDNVPSFASIARMPGFDAQHLTFFLLDPHPKMPNMGLSRAEAADLAAYITRLGR